MTLKMNSKKAKTETPKAPPVVYVEIDEMNNPCLVDKDPTDAEDARSSGNHLARYKFDSFVTVEFKPVITDVPA
jgi:hypothetical protein